MSLDEQRVLLLVCVKAAVIVMWVVWFVRKARRPRPSPVRPTGPTVVSIGRERAKDPAGRFIRQVDPRGLYISAEPGRTDGPPVAAISTCELTVRAELDAPMSLAVTLVQHSRDPETPGVLLRLEVTAEVARVLTFDGRVLAGVFRHPKAASLEDWYRRQAGGER